MCHCTSPICVVWAQHVGNEKIHLYFWWLFVWDQIKEFRAEVDIMACMRHVNVVQFVGACTKVSPHACLLSSPFPPPASLSLPWAPPPLLAFTSSGTGL